MQKQAQDENYVGYLELGKKFSESENEERHVSYYLEFSTECLTMHQKVLNGRGRPKPISGLKFYSFGIYI